MKYQAFTNDSLAMMHHGARGALAVDDELSKLGEEPRFKVRTTSDWAEHAADLETEMVRRGMNFEAIDLSAPVEPDPGEREAVSTESVSTDSGLTDFASPESVAAEPDSTKSVSSESAPTAPALPFGATSEPVSNRPTTSKASGSADHPADHDTRLRSRIAAVLKIRS
jgi:hypothetical protein